MFRLPRVAPLASVDESRRGRVVGKFCLTCGSVYAQHAESHSGKPRYGKDHVASPCLYEGQAFAPGAGWWQPAVEVAPPGAEAPRD